MSESFEIVFKIVSFIGEIIGIIGAIIGILVGLKFLIEGNENKKSYENFIFKYRFFLYYLSNVLSFCLVYGIFFYFLLFRYNSWIGSLNNYIKYSFLFCIDFLPFFIYYPIISFIRIKLFNPDEIFSFKKLFQNPIKDYETESLFGVFLIMKLMLLGLFVLGIIFILLTGYVFGSEDNPFELNFLVAFLVLLFSFFVLSDKE